MQMSDGDISSSVAVFVAANNATSLFLWENACARRDQQPVLLIACLQIVAWTASMKVSMKIASARSGIFGSMTSGEGLHCEFVGPGVVYVQSHKPSIVPGGGPGTRNGGGHSGANPIGVCIFFLVFFLVVLGFILAVYISNATSGQGRNDGWSDYRHQQYNNGYQRVQEL